MKPNFMAILAGLLLVSVAARGAEQQRDTQPYNILFISLDDLRTELGCYGAKHVISPHIDQLAEEGVVFTRAYCQQAICNPSRASLLTGYYPDQIKVCDLPTHFRDTTEDVVTLPQFFSAHGYWSVFAGKIFHPTHEDPASWNEAPLTRQAKSWWLNHSRPVKKKFDQQKAEAEKNGDNSWLFPPAMEVVPNDANIQWLDQVVADLSIKKLQEFASKKIDKPFFLGVGFTQTHLPFTAPKKYWDMYDPARIPIPKNGQLPENMPEMALNTAAFLHAHADLKARGVKDSHDAPMPEDLARQLRHGYLACTTYMDAQVGRVIDELDRLGLRDNTIICLWSDHGWKLGEHQGWSKMTNFEIDTRCPFIISHPDMKALKNRSCDAIVEFVDIYPTLADLAGFEIPEYLPGQTLKPLLENPAAKHDNVALSQYLRGGMRPESHDGKLYMGYTARSPEFRYTEWYRWDKENQQTKQLVARELYDHRTNNLEDKNVAGNPEYREEMGKMAEKLAAKRKGIANSPQPELK